MEENILIYNVKSGDTLDKIGTGIGMTGDQLRDFHNSQCEKMDKLWFNNLVGVKQIIIPKSYKSNVDVWRDQQKELPPATVTRDFYADAYSVSETFFQVSENDIEIDYKVSVSFRNKYETNSPDEVADVKCSDFTKSGEDPDDKMSSISIASMASIYPISFTVPYQGGITGIFDFSQLKKRFENKKPDLEDFFVGDVYQKYLNKFSQSLGREDFTLKQLASTLLYQLLFPKMEWFHKTGNWKEGFYLIQNSFKINCAMSAEYDHTDSETAKTFIKGNISDRLSLQELLRGVRFETDPEVPAEGEIQFRYITSKTTKKMSEAEVSLILKTDDKVYIKQTLKLTQDA